MLISFLICVLLYIPSLSFGGFATHVFRDGCGGHRFDGEQRGTGRNRSKEGKDGFGGPGVWGGPSVWTSPLLIISDRCTTKGFPNGTQSKVPLRVSVFFLLLYRSREVGASCLLC